MEITDYVQVLAGDKYGSVFVDRTWRLNQVELALGHSHPIERPDNPAKVKELVDECIHQLGRNKAAKPEDLGTIECDGKSYHVFFIHYDCDKVVTAGIKTHFVRRWFIERHAHELKGVNLKLWGMIKDRPFERVTLARAGR